MRQPRQAAWSFGSAGAVTSIDAADPGHHTPGTNRYRTVRMYSS